ncbi:hypothetical protein L917_07002, partial [Phytophthora nicotianae]
WVEKAVSAINEDQKESPQVDYMPKSLGQDPCTADTELFQEHIARLKDNFCLYSALLQKQHVEG